MSLLNRIFASHKIDGWASDHTLAAARKLNLLAADLIVTAEIEVAKAGMMDGLLGQSAFINRHIAPLIRAVVEPVAFDLVDDANRALPDVVAEMAQWSPQAEYAEGPEAAFDGAKDILAAAVPLVGGMASAAAVPFAAVTTTTALFGLVSFTAISWPVVVGGSAVAAVGVATGVLNTAKLKDRTTARLRHRVSRFILSSLIEGTEGSPAVLQQLAAEFAHTARRAKAI